MAQLSTLGVMRVIISFILALLVASCASQPSPRLTQKKATAIAMDLAQRAGYKLDGYEPRVFFRPEVMTWNIYFVNLKPHDGPVEREAIIHVDDKTGIGTFIH